MLTGMFRTWVHVSPEVLWSILLDGVESPQRYASNVESSRVLERQGGEDVKELMVGHELAPGVFDFFVLNRGVLREIKSGEKTSESVTGVFRYIHFDSVILREITVQGVQSLERILISNEGHEIRRELIMNPNCSGTIVVRVVPVSVQNPMAPVDLQFETKLAPRPAGDPRWQEEMLLAIREEQRSLKAAAEKS